MLEVTASSDAANSLVADVDTSSLQPGGHYHVCVKAHGAYRS